MLVGRFDVGVRMHERQVLEMEVLHQLASFVRTIDHNQISPNDGVNHLALAQINAFLGDDMQCRRCLVKVPFSGNVKSLDVVLEVVAYPFQRNASQSRCRQRILRLFQHHRIRCRHTCWQCG